MSELERLTGRVEGLHLRINEELQQRAERDQYVIDVLMRAQTERTMLAELRIAHLERRVSAVRFALLFAAGFVIATPFWEWVF